MSSGSDKQDEKINGRDKNARGPINKSRNCKTKQKSHNLPCPFLLALHGAEEEERAVGEEDAVRRGVCGRGADGAPVPEPLDLGGGRPAGLATQGHGLVPGDGHGDGVLRDGGGGVAGAVGRNPR